MFSGGWTGPDSKGSEEKGKEMGVRKDEVRMSESGQGTGTLQVVSPKGSSLQGGEPSRCHLYRVMPLK